MPGGTLGRMPRRGRPPKGTAEPEYEPIQLTQRSSIPDGHLPVGCWCEARALIVPAELVSAGRTGSCGRVACTPPAHRHMSLHGKAGRPGAARGIDIITALFPDPAGGYRSFTERFAEAHLEHEFFAADDDGVLRPLSSFPVEDLGDGWTRQGPFIRFLAHDSEVELTVISALAAADPPTLAEVFRPVQVTSESVE